MKKLAVSIFGLALAAAGHAETIAPGMTGDELIAHLRGAFQPRLVHSYKQSRRYMFGQVDNVGGRVRLVYSGHSFPTQGIPNANNVNTEHTWPQSKFKRAGAVRQKAKADLHHLFPTFNRVNGERGSKPFAEIPDHQTESWWVSKTPRKSIPGDDIAEYSESTQDEFEPREDHKGDVARSMAYFFIVYGGHPIDHGWFRPQIPTMREWNALDPVSPKERERSAAIAEIQGNENPFVLDPTLYDRVFAPPESAPGKFGEMHP